MFILDIILLFLLFVVDLTNNLLYLPLFHVSVVERTNDVGLGNFARSRSPRRERPRREPEHRDTDDDRKRRRDSHDRSK